MDWLKVPEDVIVISYVVDKYTVSYAIFNISMGCMDFREDRKTLLRKLLNTLEVNCCQRNKERQFSMDSISFMEIVIQKMIKGLQNSANRTVRKDLQQKYGYNIILPSIKLEDLSLFLSESMYSTDSNKSVSSLDYDFFSKELRRFLQPFSITIYKPPHLNVESKFYMLCPIFPKLVTANGGDKMSPISPPRHEINGGRTIPFRGALGTLMRTPRNLLLTVLGWSGDAPTFTIEAFDPRMNRWFYVSQQGFIKRAYHGVVMLGVLIYVIGGYDGRICFDTVFCFNVETREWYRRSSLHVPRCYATCLVYRGQVYVMGGFDGEERLRSCEMFDQDIRNWKYLASMNEIRSDASGAVHKGKIFMCGGFNGIDVLTSVEIYDIEQDHWTIVGHMLSPRSGHVMISYKSVLLIMGGYDGEDRLRSVERYDDAESKWRSHVPMLSRRSNFAAAILDDKIYVIAGYNGYTTFTQVEEYDDISQKWKWSKGINKHRSAHGACVFQDTMTISMCTSKGHTIVHPANMENSSP